MALGVAKWYWRSRNGNWEINHFATRSRSGLVAKWYTPGLFFFFIFSLIFAGANADETSVQKLKKCQKFLESNKSKLLKAKLSQFLAAEKITEIDQVEEILFAKNFQNTGTDEEKNKHSEIVNKHKKLIALLNSPLRKMPMTLGLFVPLCQVKIPLSRRVEHYLRLVLDGKQICQSDAQIGREMVANGDENVCIKIDNFLIRVGLMRVKLTVKKKDLPQVLNQLGVVNAAQTLEMVQQLDDGPRPADQAENDSLAAERLENLLKKRRKQKRVGQGGPRMAAIEEMENEEEQEESGGEVHGQLEEVKGE